MARDNDFDRVKLARCVSEPFDTRLPAPLVRYYIYMYGFEQSGQGPPIIGRWGC